MALRSLPAWHDAAVGIDIGRVEPCSVAFAQLVCTRAERAQALPDRGRDGHLSSLWSSKESLAKPLGDPLRYEPTRLGSPMYWPNGRAGTWRAASLQAPGGNCLWVCWREPGRAAHRTTIPGTA